MVQFHRAVGPFKPGERALVLGTTDGGVRVADADKRRYDMLIPFERASHFTVYRPSSLDLAKGDRVRITVIRQLIRSEPLDTIESEHDGQKITLPTAAEMLRIKGALILKRNATRDYIDFAALSDRLGDVGTAPALKRFDELYPQPNGESALQQLQIQLANPLPYDLEATNLAEYKSLNPRWHDWNQMKEACAHSATVFFDRLAAEKTRTPDLGRSRGHGYER